jgi:hypothetical protein
MSSDIAEPNGNFQKVVEGLVARPSFLAHLLAKIFDGDVSAKRIATELGCSEASALRLAMMRVPRADRQLFREDLQRIAEATDVDGTRLLSVIKQAQVLSAFDVADNAKMLLAARDVVPDRDKPEE